MTEIGRTLSYEHGTVTVILEDDNKVRHLITIHVVRGDEKCPHCSHVYKKLLDGDIDVDAEIEQHMADLKARAATIASRLDKHAKPSKRG